MTDQELVKAFKESGEGEYFGSLYDRYFDPIFRFIYYKTHHRETAEDITSLVFTKALERVADFDFSKGTIQAWLYQIARNAVVDYYRRGRERLTEDISDAWDIPADTRTEKDTENGMLFVDLQKYLHEISAEQREIIILRIWEELSYKEIAEIVGKSEGSCKMAFARGIKKLQEIMPAATFLTILLYIVSV